MGDDLLNATSEDRAGAKPVAAPNEEFAAFLKSGASLVSSVIANRYRLDSLLGLGGWSAVYQGTDLTLGRAVAVKVLHPHLTVKPVMAERFRDEAEITSKLAHPNLTAVYDYGMAGDHQPYIVMELVTGTALDEIIDRGGPLAVQQAVSVMVEMADALQVVHDVGLVHRDIKPGNIMITATRDGQCHGKLLDFGLVKALETAAGRTATGETIGTPAYMSPEQCRGEKVDARSDIYSLGCVLYEMLTGQIAFAGDNPVECMHKHMLHTPPPISKIRPELQIPEILDEIVECALQRERADRFPSMHEFKEALLKVATVGATASSIPKLSVKRKAKKKVRRNTRLGLTAGISFVAFCAAAFIFGPKMAQQALSPTTKSQRLVGHSATDVGLQANWQQLVNEQELDLTGTDVTNEGLAYVGKLKNLKHLVLAKTSVDNMDAVAEMTNLESLSLSYTHISKSGLLKLQHLKKLRALKVCGLNLSSDDLAELKDALPDCRIVTDDKNEYAGDQELQQSKEQARAR
jgi:serine/threonine protein kinase